MMPEKPRKKKNKTFLRIQLDFIGFYNFNKNAS